MFQTTTVTKTERYLVADPETNRTIELYIDRGEKLWWIELTTEDNQVHCEGATCSDILNALESLKEMCEEAIKLTVEVYQSRP